MGNKLIFATKLVLVVGVAYFLGAVVSEWNLHVLKEIGGLWSVISGIIVFRERHVESFKSGLERLLGTFIGTFIGGLYLSIYGGIWFFPLAIWVVVLICLSTKHLGSYKTPAIACAIVIIIWQLGIHVNIWLYCFSRFLESTLGVVTAFLIVRLPPHIQKKNS